METEKTMKMIRDIRDKNSRRRIKLSQEERDAEDKIARDWFMGQVAIYARRNN